jgi:integrase
VDFRYKGVRCRERLRLEPTSRNLRYAQNLKARIEHEIQSGTFDYSKHFPNSRKLGERLASLSAGLARFLERVRVSPETQEEYGEYISLIPAWLKEKPINQITQADIEGWLEGQNYSRKRINNLLIPLRGAFRKAYRDGEIKVNPLQGLRIEARKTESKIDPFTRSEIALLSAGFCGRMWNFWAWTGLRSGEIAGLDWGDVDPSGDAVTIRRSVRMGREKGPKTQAGTRRIRLLQPARSALGDRGQGRAFLNPATGQPFQTDRQIREAFRRACAEGNVRYRYPYQLRHTFASWALSSGENPLWVAKQMGHKDVSMVLRVYGRYIPEMDPLAGTRMVR